MRPAQGRLALIGALIAGCAASLGGVARAEPVEASEVLGYLSADWDGQAGPDKAVLVGREDGADLHLYLDRFDGPPQAVIARGVAWRGAMYGQAPGLEPSPAGGIVVTSENSSIGRNRWSQRLILAWRDGAMRVAGMERTSYDTLDLDAGVECEVNFLTGAGRRNGAAFVIDRGAVPIEAWSWDASPPSECY